MSEGIEEQAEGCVHGRCGMMSSRLPAASPRAGRSGSRRLLKPRIESFEVCSIELLSNINDLAGGRDAFLGWASEDQRAAARNALSVRTFRHRRKKVPPPPAGAKNPDKTGIFRSKTEKFGSQPAENPR